MINLAVLHDFCLIFHVFKENAPGGGVLARFYRLGGGSFELFFGRGWGIRPSKKLPGGVVRLRID